MAIVKKSGLLSSDEAYKLIEPVVIKLVDEMENDPRIAEDVAGKLGFVPFEASTKNGQIQTKLGVMWTPTVGEFDSFVLDEDKYGNKISYDIIRKFPAEGMSSEAKKQIEMASKINDIPEELKKDLAQSLNRMKRQYARIRISQNEYLTKVFTKGFDAVSATFGPWSAVYDGKPLFADDHLIIGTGGTQPNIVDDGAGNHAPLTYTSLKKAVGMLREMKDGLGVRVKRPMSGIYDLIVSPELESVALDVLSDGNGVSPYTYTGAEATNGNFANIFSTRDGFKVRLVVLETMNQPDSENPATTVGTDTMWFVLNREGAINREAFLDVKFGDLSMEVYYDQTKRATFLTAEKFFGAQALYPEVVVGSKGDGSAI